MLIHQRCPPYFVLCCISDLQEEMEPGDWRGPAPSVGLIQISVSRDMFCLQGLQKCLFWKFANTNPCNVNVHICLCHPLLSCRKEEGLSQMHSNKCLAAPCLSASHIAAWHFDYEIYRNIILLCFWSGNQLGCKWHVFQWTWVRSFCQPFRLLRLQIISFKLCCKVWDTDLALSLSLFGSL